VADLPQEQAVAERFDVAAAGRDADVGVSAGELAGAVVREPPVDSEEKEKTDNVLMSFWLFLFASCLHDYVSQFKTSSTDTKKMNLWRVSARSWCQIVT
jgi:hypothetical protein